MYNDILKTLKNMRSFKTYTLFTNRIHLYQHFQRCEFSFVLEWSEPPVLLEIGFLFWSIEFELTKYRETMSELDAAKSKELWDSIQAKIHAHEVKA